MQLFFRKYGAGEPVIILHGLFGISDNWITHAKRLAEKFEVFIPDLRNHGQSPHSHVFNYQVLVEDLLEYMQEQQLEKAIIIGHSMGGKVAMNFALAYPYMINKLVVIDISPRAYPVRQIHNDIIQAMESVNFDEVDYRQDVEEKLKSKIPSERLRLFIMKNLYRVNRGRLGWRINLKDLADNMDSITDSLLYDSMFPGQTLFIRGSESDYITEDDEDLILDYFPNAYIETIEGASHWVHADAPDELCKLLTSFLGKECVL
ncbi:MAG TPA: alpha/beta fold hydrolase [Bacteroidales bacterium]|nr:alpha/beta fold hydrolase [Bacteroidales bacterium]